MFTSADSNLIPEFQKALELLGLHTENEGLPGPGGVPKDIVYELFKSYDADGSGHIDFTEFCDAMLKPDVFSGML